MSSLDVNLDADHHVVCLQMDVDWRVGVALESSECKDLREPYVTLVFQVGSDASTIESETVELSVAQFQEVAAQFKEMARLVDLA